MNKGGKDSVKHRWIQISNQLEITSYLFSKFIYKSAKETEDILTK